MLSVKDTVAFQSGIQGSTSHDEWLPSSANDGTGVIKTVYQCERADTVLYSIEGGGHAWPPNEGVFPRIAGKSSNNIDATEVIWEFFKNSSTHIESRSTPSLGSYVHREIISMRRPAGRADRMMACSRWIRFLAADIGSAGIPLLTQSSYRRTAG